MATNPEREKYEIDLVIRKLEDKLPDKIYYSETAAPIEKQPRWEVAEEKKHFKLDWKQAAKILFDKFLWTKLKRDQSRTRSMNLKGPQKESGWESKI